MGILVVDQIAPDGSLLSGVDAQLTNGQKNEALLAALPGARVDKYAGDRVVRFGDQVILRKQVTHLGFPWPEYKKRIQIPKRWLDVHRAAAADGLTPRFIGIYQYGGVTIFVDFDPTTYVRRKANNSAAHVSTNDLYQAQTLGQFSRVDRNGNRLTSVRADEFASYLRRGFEEKNPHLEVLQRFNQEFLGGHRLDGLDAVKEMHAAKWPDTFQTEWAGFYLEYRLATFVREQGLGSLVTVQKVKRSGYFDYDLAFITDGLLDHYGDLKASNILLKDAPGNDAADFLRCLEEYERFWYVIYEHETWHSRNSNHRGTIAWNEWKRSVGYSNRKAFNALSYSSKFKESVRFVRMKVLEVNRANRGVVLGDFIQGSQPDGSARAPKVMIKKKDIDNFLIYSEVVDPAIEPV